MKKVLIGVVVLVILAAVCTVALGGGDEPSESGETVTRVQVPGEATLDTPGEVARTSITGATVRQEALPGNEFTRAPEGKSYILFATQVSNVGEEDLDLNSTVYRLQLPSGEILDHVGIGGPEEGFDFGTTLIPGASKDGVLAWEVPTPQPGQNYIILWKPNPFDSTQAQFTYTHQ